MNDINIGSIESEASTNESLSLKPDKENNAEKEVSVKHSLLKRCISILFKLFKKLLFVAGFIGLSAGFSMLSTIHGKEIPSEYFVNGNPSILGLMNSEFFMGLIFMVTLSIVIYVLYLLWELHEVAVHKAQKVASQHVQVVFALSLCGLFIDKVWWVLAIVIAFTRWDLISFKLSEIISNGVNGKTMSNGNKKGDKS